MTLTEKIHSLKRYFMIGAAALALTFAPKNVVADDFAKGIRPPTGRQLELRLNYQDMLSTIFIPKYFSKEMGIVAVLPYDWTNKKAGDATFIAAALPVQGTINLMPHIGVTIPSGENSSGAHVFTYGLFATLRPKNYWGELSVAAQYKLVGKDREGNDVPNQYYIGTLAGVRVAKNLRIGAGTRHSNKGHEFRVAVKYMLPKNWFAELHYAVQKDKKPKIEIQIRKNI